MAAFDANLGIETADTASATRTLTTSSAAASNSLIVACLGAYENFSVSLSSVSGGGLTWTIHEQNDQFLGVAIATAPAPAGLASSTVLTATWSANVGRVWFAAMSFTSMDTSGSREDGTSSSREDDNTTINSASWTGQSVTTTNPDDVLIGVALTSDTNGPFSSSPGGSFTEVHDANGFGGEGGGFTTVYRIVSSAGAYTPSGTWSATQNDGASDHATVALKSGSTPITDAPEKIRIVQSALRW